MYSRETVWGVLTGQACECTSNLVGHEVREIETWILRLLSAPVSLPEKTKRVYILRKVYGLKHKEIAEKMDISLSSVEKHLKAAILK